MAEFKTDERKLQEVSSILKAVLTSFGGELPMNQIDSEYRTVVGSSIPYKELKHGTLASFLQSIPSILKLQNRGGQLVVTVVNDDNINLILQQVKQQNNKCNKSVQKKKRYTEYGTRQLHASPNPRIPSLLNMRWQNNTNWQQQHTSSWQSQTIPTRPRFQSRANSQTHSSFQQPAPKNDKAVDRNNTPPPQKVQLPPISLPTTPTWNVFVTCVDDGNTIKLVLIGEQYSVCIFVTFICQTSLFHFPQYVLLTQYLFQSIAS
ncbi:Tudor domain-containing protein 7 [Portunus trituberculatus]|uniref:Tudor domain-containing protein 7 n=1 Tax=Portunus trituberculatus TaxID=210409 RepID=A0A5B7DG09_PORTR|nr:Tudor domain-containing protein 7 [Portunus trituberculatus]